METHVKVLAVLYIVLGGIGLLVALLFFFGGATLATIVGMSAPPEDAAVAVPVVGVVGTLVAAVLLLCSLPGVIAGWGLLKLRPWARVLGIVLAALAILSFFAFPFTTAVGIYGLWVLLTKDTERLFNAAAAATPAAVPPAHP